MAQTAQTNPLIVAGVVAIVVGGVAFVGGMKYQQSQQANLASTYGNRQGGAAMMGGRGMGGGNRLGIRPVNGEIIASDTTSMTVKLADGSSKIVLFTTTTAFSKADAASKSDLKTGDKVAVFGQENSDGSVSAQTIQLNPIARPGMMGTQPSATPTSK